LSISVGATAFTQIPSSGPTSAAIRSTTLQGPGRLGWVGRRAGCCPAAAEPLLASVDPDRCEPGGRRLLHRRTAELTPRAGHDRRTLVAGTHGGSSAETAAKTRVMGHLLSVVRDLVFQGVFRFTTGKVKGRHRIPVI
jgi:hypothetical protein